jgi:hypothetical protein
VEARAEITADVIAGEVTLLHAAARLRAANADLPQLIFRVKMRALPGNSDDERACRWVIGSVEATLEGDPRRRDRIVNRLKAELREYLKRQGPLVSSELDCLRSVGY